MKSPFKFKKHGKSGIEMSELWPHLGGVADDICVVRSMYAEIPNHEPSHHDDEHGRQLARPPVDGLVDHLRPGHGEPEPARATSC